MTDEKARDGVVQDGVAQDGVAQDGVARDLLERGLAIRGEVIGAARSAAALAGAGDFDRPFQELALRYCWGEVWDRPGLDRRTRSIVNLAMLAAMGRTPELKIHVRGALTNGVSEAEIQEVFLQLCIYCGVPAAGEAFKAGKEVFAELAAERATGPAGA